jgi:glutathione S-transferase
MSEYTLIIANKRYSSWSMRGWLAMKLAGVPFDEIVIPLDLETTKAAIAEHSPSGLVPTLKHGPRTIWDSLSIIEYLAELFPGHGFWPEDPTARAFARSVSAEMHSGFRALRGEMPMNIGATKPGHAHSGDAEADVQRVMRIWRDCLHVFGGGPFLFGPVGAADIMYAPVITRFETYGIQLDDICRTYARNVMTWPPVMEWCEAAKGEPWVIEKYEAA